MVVAAAIHQVPEISAANVFVVAGDGAETTRQFASLVVAAFPIVERAVAATLLEAMELVLVLVSVGVRTKLSFAAVLVLFVPFVDCQQEIAAAELLVVVAATEVAVAVAPPSVAAAALDAAASFRACARNDRDPFHGRRAIARPMQPDHRHQRRIDTGCRRTVLSRRCR